MKNLYDTCISTPRNSLEINNLDRYEWAKFNKNLLKEATKSGLWRTHFVSHRNLSFILRHETRYLRIETRFLHCFDSDFIAQKVFNFINT